MKVLKVVRILPVAVALSKMGDAQTKIDLRTQAKSVDFSGASYTLPSQTGPVLPATCAVGATFILTTSLAGQNWYICTSTNQWTAQGSALPSTTGNNGGVLSTNGSSLLWTAFGGDISGAPGSISVNRLLGRQLNPAAPSAGQVLGWDGSQWSAQTVTISPPVATVFGRTGAIAAQTGDYSFAQISGVAAPAQLPAAGGDLSGSLTSATVTQMQGRPIANTTPFTGQALAWNGTQWAPQSVAGGVASVFGRTGSVTAQFGDYTASQVIHAADVSAANTFAAGMRQTFTPAAGGAGINVAPGSLPTFPQAGDLAVDSGDSNNIKVYSGSSWVRLGGSSAPGSYTAAFTAATSVSVPGTTHGLGTSNLLVQCYDNASPSNYVEPSQISINPTAFDVTIAFATAESGRCVLAGGVGGGSGGSGSGGGAGMASQLGDLAATLTNSTTLAIGANCSAATPCNVRFGAQTYSLTSSATATLTGGSGIAYVYVDPSGTLTVGSVMSITCSTACSAVPGVSSFPLNSIPIYTWTASSGAWDATGGVDRRGFLSVSPVQGGSGIATVATAGQTTISIDSAVVPTFLTASATLDFPSIAAGTCSADMTISLPGANAGDAVASGWPAAMESGLNGTMRISAAGVVSVRLCADATGAVNPAAATFTATVVRSF